MRDLFHHVPVLDTGARGATNSFAQRGLGDVLLAWENEAWLARKELGADEFAIVYPSLSILAEPPVAVVDSVVDKKGTRAVAEAYLRFLYTQGGPGHRREALLPAARSSGGGTYARTLSGAEALVTIDDFGGWDERTGDLFRRWRYVRPHLHAGEMMPSARRSALPGFALTFGITLLWLSLIVLLPLAALMLRPWELGLAGVWHSITEPRVLASLRLSFGIAALAAVVNVPFGLLVAWVMVRYRFPGRNLADSLIDMPLALPTAVAGIALTALFAPKGWIGATAHATGYQGRLHATRHPGGADFRRPAVRRAHAGAGHHGSAAGRRGGRCDARRDARADRTPRGVAGADAGIAGRLRLRRWHAASANMVR